MSKFLPAFAAVLALLVPALSAHAEGTAGDCRVGAYRLADGRILDIGPQSEPQRLRWRTFEGTSGLLSPAPDGSWTSTLGWTGKPDGKRVTFAPCAQGRIVFDHVAGQKIALSTTDTVFTAPDGTKLAGRLVLPKGAGPVPVFVMVHGSEKYSGRDIYPQQRLFPAKGVGVFVYDKRGTGHSAGHYSQDFSLLADDATAAFAEAKRLAGRRLGRIGYYGGSQGGWIAPLAASRSGADFVIVGFGLAIPPIEEDREEVILDMQLKGHSQAEIDKALELQAAAAKLVESRFTEGYEAFDALRAKYRSAPWYKDVGGDFTPAMLPLDEAQMKALVAKEMPDTPLRYDSMPVLRSLKTPQLWILAKDDVDAPSEETSRRIRGLIAEGRPITLAMFPDAEHGIYEYVVDEKGERKSTRNAEGFFRMIADFARDGRLHGTYGRSVVTAPAAPKR